MNTKANPDRHPLELEAEVTLAEAMEIQRTITPPKSWYRNRLHRYNAALGEIKTTLSISGTLGRSITPQGEDETQFKILGCQGALQTFLDAMDYHPLFSPGWAASWVRLQAAYLRFQDQVQTLLEQEEANRNGGKP